MIALDPDWTVPVLVALVGAFGIVIAATVPMLWAVINTRRTANQTRDTVGDQSRDLHKVTEHLPPNGERLYDMVREVRDHTRGIDAQVLHLRVSVVRLAERLDTHLEETEPLIGYVRGLMEDEGGDT